jgi:cytochrome c oxidase subunit IV
MADTELQEHEEAAPARGGGSHGHPSVKEYVRIGVILAVITGAEVATYYVQDDLGGWLLPILFVLSIVKFVLVVLWYMHLKFDSRLYSRFFVMGLAGAVTLYLVVLLTFRVFVR